MTGSYCLCTFPGGWDQPPPVRQWLLAMASRALPPEILKKVRRINIVAGRKVDEAFAGQFRSVFRGAGIEFEEVREYVVGDDVRSIDWNVTARAGKPYVKRYVEERERRLVLVVDLSGSQRFGTADTLKVELAAEVAAVLAAAAIRSNDKVGLVAFTAGVEHFVPARKGARHALRVIRDVLGFQPELSGTDLAGTLEHVNRVLRRGAILVLISDFLTSGYEKALVRAARRHDVIAVRANDPREDELPAVGLVRVADLETGEVGEVDASHPAVREEYRLRAAARRAGVEALMRRAGADYVEISTNQDYVDPLRRLFEKRARRRGARRGMAAGVPRRASPSGDPRQPRPVPRRASADDPSVTRPAAKAQPRAASDDPTAPRPRAAARRPRDSDPEGEGR